MSPDGHKQIPEDLQDELVLLRAENEFLTDATENIHLLNAVAEQIALEPGPDQAFWVLMENLAAVKECSYLALFAIESGVRLIREYPDRTTPQGVRRWHALPQDYRQINTRWILPIDPADAPPFWRKLCDNLTLPDRTEQLLVLPFFRQDRPYRLLILTPPNQATPDTSGFLSILERIRDLIESRIRANDMIAQIRTLNDQLQQKLEREREINADLREQFAAEVTFDSKTGLLSRYGFFQRFGEAVGTAGDRRFAVMKVNINRFATVNHTLGPDAGDVIIRVTAQRIQRVLRYTDVLARVGGDHFLILLVAEHEEAHQSREIMIAHQIFDEMGAPFVLRGKELVLSISIGITYPAPDREVLPEKLADQAHQAMIVAKGKNENRFEIYSGSIAAGNEAERLLEIDLWKGIKDDAFFMLFQPIVSLATGRIAKLESLVRWNHPTLGQITPARFIPIANKTGLIVELGNWILSDVARTLRRFDREYPRDAPISVSVNVSVKQLITRGFVDNIRTINATLPRVSWDLGIEITESELIRHFDRTKQVLEQVSATGIAISLDDFGTGYSSLSYLPNLKYDIIKIPREFILPITKDSEHRSIVKTIISLAHTLGKEVVIEGVETREQLTLVQSLAADYVQGYYFLKPATEAQIVERLQQGALQFEL